MILKVVDVKKKEVINVKVELSDKLFVVVPAIYNEQFEYMRYRLMKIRKTNMDIYLKDPSDYKMVESTIVREMVNELEQEIKRIKDMEGLNYYLV